MENQKVVKAYKLWHVAVAFVVGAVLTAGVVLVPSYTGSGFTRMDLKNQTSATSSSACASASQVTELSDQLNSVYMNQLSALSQINDWINPSTGQLSVNLQNRIDGTYNEQLASLSILNGWINPTTGQLSLKLYSEHGDIMNSL